MGLASIIVSSIAIIISFYSLYLTHLKKPDINFYTDGKVDIYTNRNFNSVDVKLRFTIHNSGASIGEITDLLLKLDDDVLLIPREKNGLPTIIVEENSYENVEIEFTPPLELKTEFKTENFLDDEKHKYILIGRLNGKKEWEELLKREFINKRTVFFREGREEIIDSYKDGKSE
jgi:hypothetical protein